MLGMPQFELMPETDNSDSNHARLSVALKISDWLGVFGSARLQAEDRQSGHAVDYQHWAKADIGLTDHEYLRLSGVRNSSCDSDALQ